MAEDLESPEPERLHFMAGESLPCMDSDVWSWAMEPMTHRLTFDEMLDFRMEEVLADPDVRQLIDFSQPVAVLMCYVLHFVSDEQAAAAVAAIRNGVPRGSALVVSHATTDAMPPDQAAALRDVYETTTAWVWPRTREQVEQLLTGWNVLAPGVVHLSEWRAEDEADNASTEENAAGATGYAAIATAGRSAGTTYPMQLAVLEDSR